MHQGYGCGVRQACRAHRWGVEAVCIGLERILLLPLLLLLLLLLFIYYLTRGMCIIGVQWWVCSVLKCVEMCTCGVGHIRLGRWECVHGGGGGAHMRGV